MTNETTAAQRIDAATEIAIRAGFVREDFVEDGGKLWATLATRDNGDVNECTPGAADIKAARTARAQIQEQVPGCVVHIDTCDEWVHLVIEVAS